jgi:SAM-dependent methyltransferase
MHIDDRRRHSPAAERNGGPILDLLRRVLPAGGTALEIACGTGQHAVRFAAGLPSWTWQPTDADPDALESTAAWAAEAALPNLRAPLHLDVTADAWPVGTVDAVFCANMIHIAPWTACVGLVAGAARHLVPGGAMILYGPFVIPGEPTAASNVAFDADLRRRDPAWGLRALDRVAALAEANRMVLVDRFPMPANNQLVVFRREGAPVTAHDRP